MEMAATVVIGGMGAFSAFCPPVTSAADVDQRRLHISLGYATAATLVLGYLGAKSANSPTPMTFAIAVVVMEWAAYKHAQYGGSVVNG
jgi:hypothetical protein